MSALALDRQAIEKKDFPIGRRGYEPEAVDLHLETLAGEVERLQRALDHAERGAATGGTAPRSTRSGGTQSLALAASEQVRLIVEAAETSAADIERSAEEEAARIRADADSEARRTRDEAVARSQDHVGSVGAATSSMLQRVDAMENELEALLESLRTGTNRLAADLSLLQGNLGDLYGAAGSTQAPAPPRPQEPERLEPPPEMPVVTPGPVTRHEIEPEVLDVLMADPELADDQPLAAAAAPDPGVPEPEPESVPPAIVPEPAEAPDRPQGNADVEGARLIALNMALNGQSREETDAYLRDNFDLDDRAALLDQVYATVEG